MMNRSKCLLVAGAALFALAAQAAVEFPPRRVNYDEAKVPPYRLEDPLVFTNGTRLVSPDQWPARRREILALLEREIYGKRPAPPSVCEIEKTEEGLVFCDLAKRRQFSMWFRKDRSGPRIDWMLLSPVDSPKPVPVIVILNYYGNHELLPDECIPVQDSWMPGWATTSVTHRVVNPVRGKVRYPYDVVLAKGYAVLTACYAQVAPDPWYREMTPEEYRSGGVYELWPKAERDVGSLQAWAWAISRGLDLAERLPELDVRRSVAFGCSRLAKAALLAGAFDERFATVVACETGGGGAPLHKRQFGENADWMTQIFPHWFCRAYLKYANNEQAMPLDSHFLLAAVAPRRLLVEGHDEPWYDTRGEWLACRAASPVWEFLGKRGLPGDAFPGDFSTAAIGPSLGYVRRPGRHGISGYDWLWMLDFADAGRNEL